jgi:hypothetical protein
MNVEESKAIALKNAYFFIFIMCLINFEHKNSKKELKKELVVE